MYRFDAVGVVSCKLGVVRGLDGFIDDSVYDTKGVELELDAVESAVGDLLVLFIEVVEELEQLDSVGSKWL